MTRWIEAGDWARPELVAGLTSLQLTGRNWRSPRDGAGMLHVAVEQLPALWSRHALTERLAGTVVVRDR
jgi:hypothetical protein